MKRHIIVLVVFAAACAALVGCGEKPIVHSEDDMFTMGAGTMPDTMEPTSDTDQTEDMRMAQQTIQSSKVYFEYDKFDLKDEYKITLKAAAGALKHYPRWRVLISGHCDERGTEEYNLALGEKRARAVYEFLIVLGVSSSRLKIVSFGEEQPAIMGNNEAAWAKNRRAEFRIFK